MAGSYRPYEPDQVMLLPAAPQDWLPAGHLAHFINDTVDALVAKLAERARRVNVGPGDAPNVEMGPVITGAARDRIVAYIDGGVAEGARLVVDGRKPGVPGHDHGFFVGPTLFDGVTPQMAIYRDEIFGPEKANLLCRAGSCGKAGIRWTVHSDDTVTEMGPMRLIDNAVNRTLWREPGGVLNPAERVSVEQAIIALTRDAAWQCHSEHEIGTLEVGKFADFVVLDRDPLAIPPEEVGAIQVLETWVGGLQVYAA